MTQIKTMKKIGDSYNIYIHERYKNRYEFTCKNFNVIACDDATESVLFEADGEICCEINGVPFFGIETEEEFCKLVKEFAMMEDAIREQGRITEEDIEKMEKEIKEKGYLEGFEHSFDIERTA